MTTHPGLNAISYDDEEIPTVSAGQPGWYRNLPGQMVGRTITAPFPDRPPPSGIYTDPGRNPDINDYELVLSWQGKTDAPIPVSLSIRVDAIQDRGVRNVFPTQSYGLFAGQNIRPGDGETPADPLTSIEARNTGFINLSYGVGGDQKHAMFDARDGTYDLPPVSWVRVNFQRYAGGWLQAVAGPPPDPGLGVRLVSSFETLQIGASLHAGSHAGDYMPVFSSIMNRVNPGTSAQIPVIAPARAREFLYGVPDTTVGLINVTASGALQTRSRILSGGPTPGSFNQPYWGPGVPLIPSSGVDGETQIVTLDVDNVGPTQQLVYAGFRIAL